MQNEQLSLEQTFLFAVVRQVISGGETVEPSHLMNWEKLVELAHYHGVAPLLLRFLNLTPLAPPSIQPALAQAWQANLQHNLRLTGELWQLVEAGKAQGLTIVPFKGPTLAMVAYGDLAWRVFGDLDIFVAESQVAQAAALLCARGFVPEYDLAAALSASFLVINNALTFKRAGLVVELHWHLSPNLMPFDLRAEQILPRLISVAPGGKEIVTLAPEELLLYICAHGARHQWERLGWIADVAGLLNRQQQLDWDWLWQCAQELKSTRVLCLGTLLARDLVGATLPPAFEQKARADVVAVQLVQRTRHRLSQPPGTTISLPALHTYYVQMQDRLREQGLYLLRLFLSPNIADWQFLPLAPALIFLYPVVRWIRLLSTSLRQS